eukprot:CAMPEP_0116040556 /NCGR_PEP_ID=MMETSP0321-20121206/24438_1 /TAXON_ID=163516 /ORGANISM="Leptocylindrus danicus var. danicus, Strain B650" /LENGTH=487 /DNA_ID=CAMNT_0003520411 /DNA_START=541 /DNA_END=2000 /DNA_ORIENTATION=-
MSTPPRPTRKISSGTPPPPQRSVSRQTTGDSDHNNVNSSSFRSIGAPQQQSNSRASTPLRSSSPQHHVRQPSDGSQQSYISPIITTQPAARQMMFARQPSDAETSVCSITSVQSKLNIVPRFSIAELKVESYIGEGGFCMVHAITGFNLQNERKAAHLISAKMYSEHELELRRRIKQTSTENGNVMYVLKRMKNNLSPEEETKAINDLAIEAGFLSRICHNNVITMAGVADQDPHSAQFFIVIDRLFETLDKRIEKRWRRDLDDAAGLCWGCCVNEDKIQDLWDLRLGVALDLAKAFHYLHSHDIIYRDLKPGNVGFDFNGVVKIFDFGLAKDLSEHKRDPTTGLYQLTGCTGSLRFMAPEVALNQPYDEKVDVYSFGILLWQMSSLLMPFPRYSKEMHRNLVVEKGERPSVDVAWQSGLSRLIQRCWVANGSSRPDFVTVIRALEREIQILRYSDYDGKSSSNSNSNGKGKGTHNSMNDLDKKYNA